MLSYSCTRTVHRFTEYVLNKQNCHDGIFCNGNVLADLIFILSNCIRSEGKLFVISSYHPILSLINKKFSLGLCQSDNIKQVTTPRQATIFDLYNISFLSFSIPYLAYLSVQHAMCTFWNLLTEILEK